MAENKNSFVLYANYLETVKIMPKGKIGELFLTILEYVNDMNPEPKDRMVKLAFEPIKQQLKRDLKKWEKEKTDRSEAGKKGGLKSGEIRRSKSKQIEAKGSNASKNEANEAVDVTVSVNEDDNGTVTEKVIINKNAREKKFILKGEVISMPVSEYFKQNFGIFWDQWRMKNGDEKGKQILDIMDSEYLGYTFTDENHVQRTFISVFNKLPKYDKQANPIKRHTEEPTGAKAFGNL